MHRNVSQSLPNLCDGTNLDISSLIIADYFPAFQLRRNITAFFKYFLVSNKKIKIIKFK